MRSRVGQVWSGVFYESEHDICLCVESGLSRGGQERHRFLDLETGETRFKREADPFEKDPLMRRLA